MGKLITMHVGLDSREDLALSTLEQQRHIQFDTPDISRFRSMSMPDGNVP
jgi:hypothetical protein